MAVDLIRTFLRRTFKREQTEPKYGYKLAQSSRKFDTSVGSEMVKDFVTDS